METTESSANVSTISFKRLFSQAPFGIKAVTVFFYIIFGLTIVLGGVSTLGALVEGEGIPYAAGWAIATIAMPLLIIKFEAKRIVRGRLPYVFISLLGLSVLSNLPMGFFALGGAIILALVLAPFFTVAGKNWRESCRNVKVA